MSSVLTLKELEEYTCEIKIAKKIAACRSVKNAILNAVKCNKNTVYIGDVAPGDDPTSYTQNDLEHAIGEYQKEGYIIERTRDPWPGHLSPGWLISW